LKYGTESRIIAVKGEKMSSQKRLYFFFTILLLVLACNLPLGASNTPESVPSQQAVSQLTPASVHAPASHLATPSDVSLTGNIDYDVESQTTSALHRAPYGDVYVLNRLERPFTQNDMTYLPDVDIVRFRLSSDDAWYYVFIELIGNNPNDPLNIDYGVEIDQNKDGFGEILIWAHPPYSTQWTADDVSVYTDTNHDSAGVSAEKSDAPFSGNGYDTVIFDQGQGQDPDLAWVRIDPHNANVVEFAFKKSLPGKTFMWGVWADALLRNPAMFSYNDRYTIDQAGSPQKENSYYPLKALYAMDSTCRAAFGFKPTSYEPLICPPLTQPASTKGPKEPPPQTCPLNTDICISQGYAGFNPANCSCVPIG
jgi:hypothetical protein